MHRIVFRLLYRLERLLARGPLLQIAGLVAVLVILAFFGGLVVFVSPTKFHGQLLAGIWWSFLHLTDTGYMGEDNEPLTRVVAIFLTFSGAILFLGGVIAILTNALDRLLASLAKGSTRVVEDGHLLIIGWNPGVTVLIEELFNSAALAGNRQLPTLVLLMETQIEGVFDKLSPAIRKRIRLVSRQGPLADIGSLERVDFRRARAILLLSQRHRLGHQASDLALLKTLMSLVTNGFQSDGCRLIMDLSHATNRLLTKEVAPGVEIEALPCLEFSGRLLCQIIRNPGIAKVYQQLLTDAFGLSLVMIASSELNAQGLTLPELVGRLRGGTAIGFLRGGVTHLLDFSEPTLPGDEVIVLAAQREEVKLGPADPPEIQLPQIQSVIGGENKIIRILVVGRNEAFESMLIELARYGTESYEIDILCDNPAGLPLDRWPNLNLKTHKGRVRNLEDLRLVPSGQYGRVVILSNDMVDPLTSDAETAMAYAILRRADFLAPDTRFLLDLQEDDNRALFPDISCDLLVSPQIGNHMLAQATMKPAWRPIYEELFTAGGAELWLISWAQLFGACSLNGFLSWGQIQRMALKRSCLAIGYASSQLHLSPNADHQVEVQAQLRLLVIEQDRTTKDQA